MKKLMIILTPVMLVSCSVFQKPVKKTIPHINTTPIKRVCNDVNVADDVHVSYFTEDMPKLYIPDITTSTPKHKIITMVVTAYCPCKRCCGRRANGRTATNTNAWKPGIAADFTCIDKMTTLYVPGYGKYKVDDTGGAMRNSWRNDGVIHIDVRFKYHWQAREWGTKILDVEVFNEGE